MSHTRRSSNRPRTTRTTNRRTTAPPELENQSVHVPDSTVGFANSTVGLTADEWTRCGQRPCTEPNLPLPPYEYLRSDN